MIVGLVPWPLVIAALLAAGTVALLRVPVLAAAIAAFAVPFGSLVAVRLGPGSVTAAPLALAGGGAAILWRGIAATRDRSAPALPHRAAAAARTGPGSQGSIGAAAAPATFRAVAIAVGVYFTVLAVAAMRAPDLAVAFVEGARWIEFALAIALAYHVAAPRSTASTPAKFTARHLLAAALLAAGAAGAAAGVGQALSSGGPPAFAILGTGLARAYGTFGQPNPFAGYMNLVWPLGAALAWTAMANSARLVAGLAAPGRGTPEAAAPDSDERRDIVPLWLGLLAGAAACLSIGGLVLSWSRGAWLAATAAGAVMALLTVVQLARRPWRAGAMAGATFAIGLILAVVSMAPAPSVRVGTFSAQAVDRVGSVIDTFAAWGVADAEVTDANYSTIERVAHWEAAYAMWSDKPWLGQGPGQYERLYSRYRLPRWSEALGHAHNIYLHSLAETGLIGLSAYLVMIATGLIFAARLAWTRSGTFAGAIGLGLLGVLTASSVHGLVDNLYVHDMTIALGLTMGLGAAAATVPIPFNGPATTPSA